MFLNKLYATIEANSTAMHERFDEMSGRLGAVDGRLGAVDGRLDALETKVDVLIDEVAQLRTDFRNHTHGPDGRVA